MSQDDDDDAEQLSPRVVHNHYEQMKNGTSAAMASKLNSVLLTVVLAVVGFLGVQLWNMSDRLARVETNVTTLLQRP